MKIRIGMKQLSDTDKEKIKLGIRKIEEYEQDWCSKALYVNVREIEMTDDEWKKVVENLPYKENTNNEVTLINNGNEIYTSNHTDKIVRGEGVIIQGYYVHTTTAEFIINLLVARTYEIYCDPEPTPKPVPQPAPKDKPANPTPEQIRVNQIKDIEKQIAEHVRAAEVATILNLTEQVRAHEDQLESMRKKLAVVQAGYENKNWDEHKYESGGLDKYTHPIPLFALQALQKAHDLFDDFRVWVERDDCDPVLVGRIISREHKTCYVIAEWG